MATTRKMWMYLALAVSMSALWDIPCAAEVAQQPFPAPTAMTPTQAAIAKGYDEIQASNPRKAIDLVDPVIAQIEQDTAKETRRLYCGISPTETLLYMVQAGTDKKSAVALAPDLCDALFIKAFALVDLDRADDAQMIFKRLVTLAPSHAQFLSELGNTYRLQKNWAAALITYEQAEEAAALSGKEQVASKQCIALRGQGYVLVELNRLDEAEKAYRKCLKAIPDEPKSLGELRYIADQRKK